MQPIALTSAASSCLGQRCKVPVAFMCDDGLWGREDLALNEELPSLSAP